MNNILSFNEYNGQELEVIAYENVLNEKSSLNKGIRGFFNRRATGKVRSELQDEIEMSKTIMEGIKEGLESLNDSFDAIEKNLDSKSEATKGKNQKTLDAIRKILDNSRKNTWDLNELIDEGEIDYTGFTANVGIASVAYFGILLTPFRAAVMIHKGYNYFFNIVKNTIRKSLVMLQLNFDQFENLIITKGFQSADYLQADDSSSKISEFYGNLNAELFGEKGKMKGKRGYKEMQLQLKAAKDRFDQQMKAEKVMQQADNAYNCLDQYNNTYTRSLETLRQYSQDDVQKQLDSIKTSMSKLAGQEVDLQTYSELIIAAAEEHAYAVSSSIYNKFAKMTEVFSLPNQQKMIDLILAANKEEKIAAKKAREEKKSQKEYQEKLEGRQKVESDGIEIFKSVEGTDIGELGGNEDDEVRKYDDSKIDAKNWTYEKFDELDDDKKEVFENWLSIHPEVLKKCDKTLQVAIYTPFNDAYYEYIDSLIDYIAPCLLPDDEIKENNIYTFDQYIFEKKIKKKLKKAKKVSHIPDPSVEEGEDDYDLSDAEKEELDEKIKDVKVKLKDMISLALGTDYEDKDDFTPKEMEKLKYIIDKSKDEKIDDGIIDSLEEVKDTIESKHKYFIDFKNIDNAQLNDLKELYENPDVAYVAFKVIGKKVLNDKTFVKNSKYLVAKIIKCLDTKKIGVSLMAYIMVANSISTLKEMRDHDYVNVDNEPKKSEE